MKDTASAKATDKRWSDAVKRARVVQRYSEISNPSLADDHAHAAELGVSVDTLYRLKKIWRHSGNPAALYGAWTRVTAEDRRKALEAARTADLTGVDPLRRDEVRRRLSIIRDYLAHERPGNAELLAAASAMGVAPSSFQKMLRSWIIMPSAAALPNSATPARRHHRKALTIPPATEAHIGQVIADLGPDASSLAVHDAVKALCERDGLKVPNKLTIYRRLMVAKANAFRSLSPAISVDHVALALPIQQGDQTQFPVLGLLFSRSTGKILAHSLSLDPPTAASTICLLQAAPDVGDDATIVELEFLRSAREDAEGLRSIVQKAGVAIAPPRSGRVGALIASTFGDSLGRVRFRPGLTNKPYRRPLQSMGRGSKPLTFQEAEDALAGIVAEHNAHASGPNFTFAAAAALAQLKMALEQDELAVSSLCAGQCSAGIASRSAPATPRCCPA